MKAKYIHYMECCLPDYFQGFSGEVIAVPVDGSVTYAELKAGVWHEYNNSCDDEIEGFKEALDSCFEFSNPDSIAFPDLDLYEDMPESAESCYAYFGIITE